MAEQSLELILGELRGELKGINNKIKEQNGAINHVNNSLIDLRKRIDLLPCPAHTIQISALNKWKDALVDEAKDAERSRRSLRRELLIAFVAAMVTGGFTLLGIWLAVIAS
jgi:hypothetical protein